jgi:hypothetical protein
MAHVSIVIVVFLALAAGSIFLQIFLSKMESKWPGLILPIIALLISLLPVLAYAGFEVHTPETVTVITEDGETYQQAAERDEIISRPSVGTLMVIAPIVILFLLYNIPTAVYLAIYSGVREKQKREKRLEKMKTQDLQ